MAKMLERAGKFYRIRRGILVEIPPQWLGKITTQKTIRQRASRLIHKLRKTPNPKFKGGHP